MVRRVYVEKRSGFDVEAASLKHELRHMLGLKGLEGVHILKRYDVEGLDDESFARVVPTVFAEPQVDDIFYDLDSAHIAGDSLVFASEALPGQFDQRADSAAECIQFVLAGVRPDVRAADVYVLEGALSENDLLAIKNYVINPVETREAELSVPEHVRMSAPEPQKTERLEGFLDLDEAGLRQMISELGLAMDLADLTFCQRYFASEGRVPTITEIRVIDTYWSDHCRHTTFGTALTALQFDDPRVSRAFELYQGIRHELGRDEKPVCLMDMATIGAKWLKHEGKLTHLDESEEINACTVKTQVDVDGKLEDWLYLFKNETHNHPTEIEPFGGAATCIGGAIRDPLSGRAYVYQAMRVTGAADPRTPIADTMEGKLPQRKIVRTAAAGYSSYGNQIGLATGQVTELYHPGYAAKRMEIGAVVAATPANHVRRERPEAGDKIIYLGGRTGRDGIGGATGSSKAHNVKSIEKDGAEVQKGNAPMERKLQRLFKRGDAARMIKRCNDFGAGGVSVAIGELADGLDINLDAVPKKYEGLDGTELAISESQERMAVAVDAADLDAFIALCHKENLEAFVVADVTDKGRLTMRWQDDVIVDISREFLASNGAPKSQTVRVCKPAREERMPDVDAKRWLHESDGTAEGALLAMVSDLNIALQKGLGERFDSTIGAATVTMPFGGKRQMTPADTMCAKLPVEGGKTSTVSGMAFGGNPYILSADQFLGSYLAIVESVSKLIAAGFSRDEMYLSLQEYFERLHDVPARWGKPTAALLGALAAQVDLGVAAIGGKDSMSGSFEKLDVPPTLVSFATALGKVEEVVPDVLQAAGHTLVLVSPAYENDGMLPKSDALNECYQIIERACRAGHVISSRTLIKGGIAAALIKMCAGNELGVSLNGEVNLEALMSYAYGSFILEMDEDAAAKFVGSVHGAEEQILVRVLGETTDNYVLRCNNQNVELRGIENVWAGVLSSVFPYQETGKDVAKAKGASEPTHAKVAPHIKSVLNFAKPRVVIPVFPGTNCEFDTERAFELAGGVPQTVIINNLTPERVGESVAALAQAIDEANILMLPGGFSGGDEPDGSAKFICAALRHPDVSAAIRRLMNERDGLMLGICNGFQALVKLGLVPYGDIVDAQAGAPTLTFNTIGRHQSGLVNTRIASKLSPWLAKCELDDIHRIAISHGEGRFVATPELVAELEAKGQIATQYCNENGQPSMSLDVNPNGSVFAIEGITSPDGRILGKMGHSERTGAGLYKNVGGNIYQPLFEGGIDYFS